MIQTGQTTKSGNRFISRQNTKRQDVPVDYAELQLKAQILDLGADSIVVVNDSGDIVYANEIAYKSHGYTREEFLNMNIMEIVSGISADIMERFYKKIDELQSEEPFIFESTNIHKDGTYIPLEVHTSVIEQAGEKFYLNIARDITERKKAEKVLADEMIRRRVLFEQSRDGIAILDKNGKVYEANQQFAEMLGYSLEEAQQLYVWDWDIQLIKKQHLELLINEEVTEKYVETIHRRKNGTEYFAEVKSYKAELSGQQLVFSICRDITERKQAEQALADDVTRRRILFDQSQDGIAVLDQNGKVFEANQRFAEMLGYTLEEVQKLHTWDWDTGLSKKQHREKISKKENASDYIETTHRRKDGTTYCAEISNSGTEYAGQWLVFSICRDITMRKKAEAEQKKLLEKLQTLNTQLEQSNQALQDFAYIASHDLREPLRKISSFGSLLQDSLSEKTDDDEKENLDFMIDGANRMQAMIDDLLTFSRITTMAKPSKPVDLNTVIGDLKNIELATKLDETGGTIVITQTLPTVVAEETQMHQLFQNLIGNGLKYHKPDVAPVITISSVNTDNNMVQIDIQDNGIGIPEEYHEKVFVMFKRLHSRNSFEGNGIGLAICKKIVNRHGGEIKVISKSGEGSTFRFTLPCPGTEDNN